MKRLAVIVAVIVAVIAIGAPAPAAPAGPAPAFTRTRLLRSAAIEQILVEDLTGDGRPDILVQQSPGRELALFAQKPDGTFAFKPDWRITLQDDVFAWCLGAVGPGGAKAPRRVCGVTPDGIVVYPGWDRRDEPVREILLCPTLYTGRSRRPPVYCELVQDLDGDGRDDVLVPQRDGMSVYLRDASGAFALNQQIPMDLGALLPQWGSGIGRLVTTYALPRVLVADLLGRGRPQLVFFAQDMLAVHTLGGDGRFGFEPEITIALRGRKSRRRFRLFQYQLPPALVDLNGDGAVDILHVLAGRGEVNAFLGTPGGRSVFPTLEKPRPPDDAKKIDGYIPSYWLRDLDGDGRQDLVLSTVEKLSVISGLQIFFTRQIDIQLMVFRGRAGQLFPREPDFVRSFTVPLSMYGTRESFEIDTPFLPNVDGDFNRDGLRDLVIKRSPTRLAIYPGVRDGVFAAEPLVELPIDALYDKTTIQVADLNGDGVSDLVLHHVDWDTLFHDVELFISK
jgi:hypothetical protein